MVAMAVAAVEAMEAAEMVVAVVTVEEKVTADAEEMTSVEEARILLRATDAT